MERITKLIKNNRQFFIGLALILCCHYGPSSTKAIFKTRANTVASVTAASWNVGFTEGANNNLSIISSERQNDTYTFQVTNNSEIDANYDIILNNVPDKVQVKLDDGAFISATDGTITYPFAGTIYYSADNKVNEHTLTFKALEGATSADNLAIELKVIISQVL